MKYCGQCGRLINDSATVCPYCYAPQQSSAVYNPNTYGQWKYCKHCGRQINDSATVCPYCYAPQQSSAAYNPSTNSRLKYCKHCGKQISESATICPYCSVPQGSASQDSVTYKTGANGFAIAGFILSLPGGLLGLIFSIIGLAKAPQYGGKGKGLAIAGITINIIWIFLALMVVFLPLR